MGARVRGVSPGSVLPGESWVVPGRHGHQCAELLGRQAGSRHVSILNSARMHEKRSRACSLLHLLTACVGGAKAAALGLGSHAFLDGSAPCIPRPPAFCRHVVSEQARSLQLRHWPTCKHEWVRVSFGISACGADRRDFATAMVALHQAFRLRAIFMNMTMPYNPARPTNT